MPNPFEQFDSPTTVQKSTNPFAQFDISAASPAKITPDMPAVGEFKGRPEDIQREIDAMTDPLMKGLAQKAFDQQFGSLGPPKSVMESVIPAAVNVAKEIPSAAVGAVQGAGSVLGGVGAFMLGIPASLPSILEGLPGSGEPTSLKRGLAAAKDKQDKIMETLTYQPKNKYGQAMAELVALPFSAAHQAIGETTGALGGDEETAKAFQYLFDVALFGLPMLKGKKGETRLPTKEEWDAASTEALVEIKKSGPKEIGGVKTEDVIGEAIGKLRQGTKDVPLSEVSAKYEGNQSYVDALRDESSARSGYAKGAYERAALVIEQMTEPLTKEQLSVIAKDPKAKTRVFVEGLLPKPTIDNLGIVREWETRNQYFANNPFRLEINKIGDRLNKAKNKKGILTEEERSILKEAELWDLEQVITGDKPAYLNDSNILSDEVLIDIAAENGLVYGFKEKGLALVVAKNATALKRVIDAPNGRELGLALGYEDLRKPKLPVENAAEFSFSEISPKEDAAAVPSLTTEEVRRLATEQIKDKVSMEELVKGTPELRPEVKAQLENVYPEGAKSLIEAEEGKVNVAPEVENKVPVFNSIEEVTGFKVMSEVPENVAKADMFREPDPEFKTVQVGDKFYRMERDTPVEKFSKRNEPNTFDQFDETKVDKFDEEYEPSESDLKAEELGIRRLIEEENASTTPPERRAEIRPEIAEAYERYKQRSVAKFNKAKSPDTQIKKSEDLTPVKEEFATFSDLAEAEAWAKAKGIEGEPIQDPLTKRWFFEPELKDLDDYSWETGLENIEEVRRFEEGGVEGYGDSGKYLSDHGTMSLVDIFNNERGSVDVTHLRILADQLREIQRTSKEMGKSVEEMLASVGMTPEAIEKVVLQMAKLPEHDKEIRRVDPLIEGIINPPKDKVFHQRQTKMKSGEVRSHVPVTYDQARTVFSARKLPWSNTIVGRYMEAVETRIHAFERHGKKVKELFWDTWVEKLNDSEKEKKAEIQQIKDMSKTFTKEERKRMSIAAIADQKGGVEALRADGINEIPTLTQKEIAGVQQVKDRLATLFDRINYVRTKIGLAPIKRIENYIPFIRNQNYLRQHGITESLLVSPVRRVAANNKRFSGTNFPFEKPRNISDIPVELDIFGAYEKYLGYAMKEIHLAPIAALAKEVASESIRPIGQKVKVGRKLANVNPSLHKLLIEWSDEIMGVDPLSTAFGQRHPFLAKTFTTAHTNLVAAMIFGNISTVLKQPTAIKGAYAMTSMRDVVHGATRLMLEKPYKMSQTRAARLSKVLDIRRAELLLSEFAESIQLGTVSGAKKLASQVTAAPMNFVDMLTAEVSWNAGFEHARRVLKLDEKGAARWADDLVTKTQGLGIRGAVAPVQTSRTFRWLAMLQTYAIADFNFLARDVLGIKNPDIKKVDQVKRVVRYMVGAALINQLFESAGMDSPNPAPIRAFSESVEQGDDVKVAMAKSFLEFIEQLPLLGGSAKYGSSLGGPVGQLASDLPKGLPKVIAALDWEGMSDKQKFSTALFVGEMLGTVYGVPMTRQIKKSIRTASQDGNWYQIILGTYIEEKRKQGLASPQGLSSSLPGL